MLTAADGRNIQIQTGGANATGANFANFNLSGGSVLNKVQRATIDLSTNNNEGIVVTGVNPNNAGLSQGPLAGILQTNSDIIKINNWNPGSGAKSQDIAINLGNSTQYGSPFSVFQLSQDGYPTGQLSGINIDASGIIQAKFSNGQSLALGEVALANFGNTQGLSPIGNSDWVDTFASGSAIVGTPGTANFGLIQSGALEDSNVDLTSELVSLIIAQRNYQANAQTIRTEDAVMQAIINLR
jgi:flagellar hook protein FlgE